MTHACGYAHPGMFTPHDVEISSGPGQFSTLYDVFGYDKKQYAPGQEPRFKPPDTELWRQRFARDGQAIETEQKA